MLTLKISNLTSLNIDHADHTILGDQRNRQFGPNIWIHVEIVGFLADITNQDGFAQLDRAAGDSFADFRTDALGLRSVTNLKADAQVLRFFIDQKNGEVFKGQNPA